MLDRVGRVHPYPKVLTLRTAGGGKARPGAASGGPTPAGIPVRLVVVTAYRSDARWRPRQLRAGETALALIDNTVAVRAWPRAALAAIARVVAGTHAVASPRGAAVAVAPRILRCLDEGRGEPTSPTRSGETAGMPPTSPGRR